MKVSTRARAAGFATVALLIGFGAACTPGGGHGGGGSGAPAPVVIYNSIPSPLPGNVGSHGFECCQTSEFGDAVHFAGTARKLTSATVTMSNWALHTTPANQSIGNATGWDQPLTLNLYAVGPVVGGHPTAGPLLGTTNPVSFHIPWRPEHDDATCEDLSAFQSTPGPFDTNCYHGLATKVTFDLTALHITAPDQVVWGVAYKTQTEGAPPMGFDGPWNSLNVGTQGTPSVGSQVSPGTWWLNTSTSGYYCDGGGVSTFRASTAACHSGETPEISFSATS